MNSVTAAAYTADPHTVTVIDEEEEQFWDPDEDAYDKYEDLDKDVSEEEQYEDLDEDEYEQEEVRPCRRTARQIMQKILQ